MFTSIPFIIGVILLVIAAVVAMVMKKQTGRALEFGNATGAPLVVGLLLVCFGVFTALRGTLINNLWWVVTVTFLSTALGLAVAVLADNRGGERAAKSLIFMPMAISLVGASIIWRFVYAARDTNSEQTGFLNSVVDRDRQTVDRVGPADVDRHDRHLPAARRRHGVPGQGARDPPMGGGGDARGS